MDIDALKAVRGQSWNRMKDLTHRTDLTGDQIEELSLLYRQSSADLTTLQTDSADPDQMRALSVGIAQARARLTGASGSSVAAVSYWFRVSLPVALYQIRWVTIAVLSFFTVIVLIEIWWLMSDPSRLAQMGTPTQLHKMASRDFVNYYSQDTNAEFGVSVWMNNAFIALISIATGVTGVVPIVILLNNAVNVGGTGAVVISEMGLWHFLSYILPHGIPELTAIFIGIAAGLRLFWAILSPGPRTRMEALGQAGRSTIIISLGLVLLLFITGFVEGFVTPSSLPVWLKILLGVIITAGVWFYTFAVGGRAARRGASADLVEGAGYNRPTAG